ncbi:MAG: GGDEF domain-containing protein [Lysobacteraceae bacterium]|nr:MAG: GGDEF domain-containing protein [Xanthomonadaceae bacterium]
MTNSDTSTSDLSAEDSTIYRTPACIVQIYGGEIGKRVALGHRDVTIGRGEDNTAVVDLSTISRHHARLTEKSRTYVVEDLGSTNGTFVNGDRVSSTRELRSGDLLKIGGAVFKFIEGGNIEALYHEEIYRLTINDGLTQIPNKRYLMDFLEREIARSERHERPLHLAMIDLDHFKAINDQMGHVAGDTVLRDIAKILNNEVRRHELAARFGGEEFTLVLPEKGRAGAIAFCEHIRKTVASHTFYDKGRDIKLTVSIGLAGMKPEFDCESFIAAADRRLYRAKASGRNCVVYDDRK